MKPHSCLVSNKYQKLCDAYDMAINNLFIELLSCASAPSMNEACNKIRNFNCTEIINNAYKVAFEVSQAENENKKKTIAPSLEETKPKVVNNEQKVVSVSDEPTKETQEKILTEPINENVEKNPPANNFYERIRAMTESNKPKLTTEIKKNDSINYEYEDEYYDEDWDE